MNQYVKLHARAAESISAKTVAREGEYNQHNISQFNQLSFYFAFFRCCVSD